MEDPESLPRLARRLDRLFRTVRPPGRDAEYTYNEVAEGVAKLGGPATSENYLYMMRTGRRDNPNLKLLAALATFFGVKTSYFTDEDQVPPPSGELQMAAALRDDAVRDIALRSAGISHSRLSHIRGILNEVRALEGLSDAAIPPFEDWGSDKGDTGG